MKNLKSNERTDGWDPGYDDNFPYHNPAGNEFPIMAYYPTVKWKDPEDLNDRIPLSEGELKILRACRFNIALGDPATWAFPMVTNVPNFSFCPEMPGTTDPTSTFIKKLKEYNVTTYENDKNVLIPRNTNFSMLGFKDEPNFNDKTQAVLENLRENYREVRRMDLPQLPYLNVAVNGKATNYDEKDTPENNLIRYLDEIQDNLLPAMWCYDYYPVYCHFALREKYQSIKDDGAQEDLQETSQLKATSEIYVNRRTFEWLEIFKQKADETERPFWYVGLSREFQTLEYKSITEGNGTQRLEPTYILRRYADEKSMRFSAFSALAYGAKGLAWWSYSATVGISGETTYNFNAPYCLVKKDDGNDETRQTELWNQLRKVNEEVHSFNDIFLKAENHEVYHTGRYIYNNYDLPWLGVTLFPGSKGAMLGLKTGDMGVLVSFFSIGRTRYVMFVNHDINSHQDIYIAWDSKYHVKKIGESPSSEKSVAPQRMVQTESIEGLTSHESISSERLAYAHHVLEAGGYMIFNYSISPPSPPTPNPDPDPDPDNPNPPPPIPPVIPPEEE